MANKFNATRAVREKIFTKLAIMSPSGGGKTFSSLRVAEGMAEEIEKIISDGDCPRVVKKGICKNCSYFEFCYINELEEECKEVSICLIQALWSGGIIL